MQSIGTLPMWLGLIALVVVALVLDLGVFHRESREISTREAAYYGFGCVGLASVFGLSIWVKWGLSRGGEFAVGYLLEEALALDNLVVIAFIFRQFEVPTALQHRVLFWGIIGAIALRALFITGGVALIARFHWLLYCFGVILFVAGLRVALSSDDSEPKRRSALSTWLRNVLPMTSGFHGEKFVVRSGQSLRSTPLFAALIAVELSDVVFAFDSIPAIFAVTRDPFIVLSSNIFAMLGLRTMYSILPRIITRFRYMKYGLAVTLCLVGIKMLLSDEVHVPLWSWLVTIFLVIGASIASSLIWQDRSAKTMT